jgi:predicted RNase H-like nuclease
VTDRTVVGVDGCRNGWVAVIQFPGADPVARVFPRFGDLLAFLPPDAVIAADMPMGLSDFTNRGGRGPESLVRPFLGERQSSVFSIPSRAAVYADTEKFTTVGRWYEAHRKASAVARATSDPPRGVSIQAFGIFPKIREIDAILRADPDVRLRVYESHPEVAFWRLNGERAMHLPKKIKGLVNPAGMEERRTLLCNRGYGRSFLDQMPPRGAASDDFLDAAAVMLVAGRITRCEAKPFPDPPLRDSHGISIAIWA